MRIGLLALPFALAVSACSSSSISANPPLPDDGGAPGDFESRGPDLASGCGAPAAISPGLVKTSSGPVRGAMAGNTWSYKGIPYAAPPTGANRFRPPADAACWSAERAATSFGAQCLQLDANGNVVGDEDCLTLNVWTPSSPPGAPLPVMVFIHGGGNTQGSSSAQSSGTFIYDAQPIVDSAPVVVVTLNYRLGALGFFALPALDAESATHVSGNYGVLDQVKALQWVKSNIAAFGGDPARVMIFGESAGGVDVCMQLVTPRSTGLFSAALIESGGCPATTLALAEAQDQALLPTVACDKAADIAACLRAIPGATLVKQLPGVVSVTGLDKGTQYGPIVDGDVIPAAPLAMIGAGSHHHVPFAIGSNAEETALATPTVASAQAYADIVHATLGNTLGDAVLAEYPVANFASPRAALIAVTTDARFVCPTRKLARAVATAQSEHVYRYFFTHAVDRGAAHAAGAWHGLELLWVFDHLDVAGYVPTPAESALAASMIGYWTRFAAGGDPNGGGATAWPPYVPSTDPYLGLDDTIASGSGVRTAHCDFWDKAF